MDLYADCDTTLAQRQAVGALCYDAGLVLATTYSAYGSLVSDVDMDAIGNCFGFTNGKYGSNRGANIGPGLNGMINPNLDASHPVALAINGTPGSGHAVAADGYGYNASTLYHHINMGWSGTDDAWYNLPCYSAGGHSFNSVRGCFYSIVVTGTGEIISGRVTDPSGNPIAGATVQAEGGAYQVTTDENGIYALAPIPSASTYTVTVAKAGYDFTDQDVEVGTSIDTQSTSRNRWGIDFEATGPTIYYIDGVSGNDSTVTGARASPYKTAQKALEMASSGDRIIILAGTYPENITLNKQVTIEAQGGLVRIRQ